MNPVLVVHGGAGPVSEDVKERLRQGIVRAATVGYCILREGGSAVDAVEGAVVTLEDNPEFNAGKCAFRLMSAIQHIEEEKSRAEKKESKDSGGKGGTFNSVLGSKLHCWLWASFSFSACRFFLFIFSRNLETVGAVALDCKGNVAYATSTGGLVNKMVGRVGDSPCVGSGGYADNDIGAISTTGHGESILKVNLARLTLYHMEQGKTVEEAADLSLGYMKSRVKGLGGLILVSKTGDWVAKWTTTSMPWAATKDGKVHFGIDPGETTIKDLA
ncbi:isoaspartyl peptidase/L-asparaginase-like [Cebus imitator]|uniref:isoaspartyl peptidase/L-asparaginase-like n=1 Tax=Cebus imitator TaxID=2715852 RepID=UPI001896AB0A|nr:isoaspartyl peptidase/L-asparaginase-like [Cebus imitator]